MIAWSGLCFYFGSLLSTLMHPMKNIDGCNFKCQLNHVTVTKCKVVVAITVSATTTTFDSYEVAHNLNPPPELLYQKECVHSPS